MALIAVFEGLPGCGKTTVIGMLAEDLCQRGLKVSIADIETIGYAPILRPITREYPLGHPIRILLFWALRLQQYESIMKSSDADVVLVDRYWGSTIAYDVYGNQVPKEMVDWLGRYFEWQPEIVLYLSAPLEVVSQRKEAKTMEDPAFAARVERGYEELAKSLGWIQVDATQKPEEVKSQCFKVILSKLPAFVNK